MYLSVHVSVHHVYPWRVDELFIKHHSQLPHEEYFARLAGHLNYIVNTVRMRTDNQILKSRLRAASHAAVAEVQRMREEANDPLTKVHIYTTQNSTIPATRGTDAALKS